MEVNCTKFRKCRKNWRKLKKNGKLQKIKIMEEKLYKIKKMEEFGEN